MDILEECLANDDERIRLEDDLWNNKRRQISAVVELCNNIMSTYEALPGPYAEIESVIEMYESAGRAALMLGINDPDEVRVSVDRYEDPGCTLVWVSDSSNDERIEILDYAWALLGADR